MSDYRLPKAGTVEIAPSILSADFANLESEVSQMQELGINIIHIDVMDGHFVPNITIGAPVLKNLNSHFENLIFDAHLMITDPDKYIEDFAKAGADHITFHVESNGDSMDTIKKLHDLGVSAGICINPDTPAKDIEKYIPHCQMLLVMTVHPGFGGQSFIGYAAEKIVELRKLAGADIRIEVDGGISKDTAEIVVGYGADTLVAGNAIFGQPDRKVAINAITSSYAH